MDHKRGSAKQSDAYVYNNSGSGHLFLVDNGDPWGWMKDYEANGCRHGIVHCSRAAGTSSKVIRRNGFSGRARITPFA